MARKLSKPGSDLKGTVIIFTIKILKPGAFKSQGQSLHRCPRRERDHDPPAVLLDPGVYLQQPLVLLAHEVLPGVVRQYTRNTAFMISIVKHAVEKVVKDM